MTKGKGDGGPAQAGRGGGAASWFLHQQGRQLGKGRETGGFFCRLSSEQFPLGFVLPGEGDAARFGLS